MCFVGLIASWGGVFLLCFALRGGGEGAAWPIRVGDEKPLASFCLGTVTRLDVERFEVCSGDVTLTRWCDVPGICFLVAPNSSVSARCTHTCIHAKRILPREARIYTVQQYRPPPVRNSAEMSRDTYVAMFPCKLC